MGRFLTEYEENWKRLSLYFLGEKKYSRLYPGRSTYYGVHMKINYECSLVHPCFWIHKLSIQSYFDMTCKWSRPRQCICKPSIKSYLWHAMKMAVLIKTNEPKDIDSDINRLTDTLFWILLSMSVTQSLSEPSRWDFLSDPGGRRWRWSWRWKWVDSLKLKLSRSWSSDWLLGEILS